MCDILRPLDYIPSFIACFGILYFFDTYIKNLRWFKLHVFANLVVCIFSFRDFFNVLSDPLNIKFDGTLIPTSMVYALHIYHIVAFNNLTTLDYIHHYIMCGLMSLSIFCKNMWFTNFALFTICGLPGGLDYIMLIMVKTGKMTRISEKYYNSKINVWIRAPLIVIASYIAYIQNFYNVIEYSWFTIFLTSGILYWNGLYFMERVVRNYGYTLKELTI